MKNVICNCKNQILDMIKDDIKGYIYSAKLIENLGHQYTLKGYFANAEYCKIKKRCYERFIEDLNYYLTLENDK